MPLMLGGVDALALAPHVNASLVKAGVAAAFTWPCVCGSTDDVAPVKAGFDDGERSCIPCWEELVFQSEMDKVFEDLPLVRTSLFEQTIENETNVRDAYKKKLTKQ